MAKSKVFKGLAATFAFIVPVAAYMSVLAYDREGDINLFLGITAGAAANQGSYASAYDSKEAMIEAETEYEIATMAEGSVLLRNENSALPLTNKKVTLFGNASVYSNYHGGSGGPSNTGFTLLEALKEEGFEVNQTVYDKIKANGYQAKNKDIAEVDPAIYDASDIGDYKDAAIVVFSRFGGEENDLDLEDSYGVPELSFHERERQTMEFVKAQGFDKVIVLLNTGYVMETGWLKDYCDAALWIAFPGSFGFKGVAQILDGKQNPSGRLVDLYAEDIMSSPAMANWGDFGFSDLPNDNYHHEYVVYAENIYVGYKYYETRYADLVRGVHNANCAKGLKASSTTWNYADEVVFPFGYGLSYTDFSTTFESLDWDRANHSVEAKVTVKNEGSVAGKYSVPLYVSAPYIDGGVEKSAIQLIGYEKTSLLEPGASEKLTIVCEDKLFASYDETATNGADSTKTGCYVFDEGDYYFAIGEDSHDALNNALAKSGATGMTDQDGNAVAGDATKSFIETLSERDNTSHATSLVTGEVVSNLFQEVNVNYYIPGAVTYMTRSDWNTYPVVFDSLKADDDASGTIRKHMTATSSLYEKPADAPSYTTFKHSQDVTIMFKDLASVEYDDDETWETFIDQLKPAELASICGEKMANDAIDRVGYPANTSCDGPDGLQGGRLHPSETLAAATFNKELIKQRGEFLGEDALYGGMSMVYGGGCNTHRSPYSGRNFEYYSEDSTVSYIAGRVQGAAMSSKGLLGAFKHFLGNDQETNRHGVATFMTEQTLREGDARAFEGALTKGAALANMGAYNRIGLLPTSSCKALMTGLLRNEWGFEGISITDSSKDATTYIFTPEAIEAGTTLFNNDANRANDCKDLLVKQRDGYMWQCVREQAKNFF
ncbi:MAG: glycoside hydrolase family 3 C-terminal domain-containing protein, partial [Bacilli bacterium]|nr:glycoside hydrolase family 3 C-terminal domain-containing protein [Bacilli bacterium]